MESLSNFLLPIIIIVGLICLLYGRWRKQPQQTTITSESDFYREQRDEKEQEILKLKNKLYRYEQEERIIKIGEVVRGTRNAKLRLQLDQDLLKEVLSTEANRQKFFNWLINQVMPSFSRRSV